jgi:predicted lipoprotein
MKIIKNILVAVIVIVVGWNCVYFEDLDEVRASKAQRDFDALKYANTFWNSKLLPNVSKAVDLHQLLSMLGSDEAKTFDTYSHALGIGNLGYFLVRGTGRVDKIDTDYIVIDNNIRLSTEYIFGNAVRDASGLIDINDFANTMDFNNVSAAINKIIREKVLPPFRRKVKSGDKVEFIGAIELNKEHLQLKNIEVIPIQLKIVD